MILFAFRAFERKPLENNKGYSWGYFSSQYEFCNGKFTFMGKSRYPGLMLAVLYLFYKFQQNILINYFNNLLFSRLWYGSCVAHSILQIFSKHVFSSPSLHSCSRGKNYIQSNWICKHFLIYNPRSVQYLLLCTFGMKYR